MRIFTARQDGSQSESETDADLAASTSRNNSIHQTSRRVEERQTLNVLEGKMGEEKKGTCLTWSNDHLDLQRYPLGF